MKKIYSIMLAALAVCAVSCQEGPLESQTPEGTGKTMTFTATMDQPTDPASKAVLNGKQNLWQDGDEIVVFANNGDKRVFTTTLSAPSLTATFTCSEIPAEFPEPYIAVYGSMDYDKVYREGDKILGITIPTIQRAVTGSYDRKALPAIAKSTGSDLQFKNLASLLEFTVGSDYVTSLTFWGVNEGGVMCTGTGNIDYSSEVPVMSLNEGSQTYAEIQGPMVKGQKYCLVILPGSYKSVSVELNKVLAKSTTKPFEFKRAVKVDMQTIAHPMNSTIRLLGSGIEGTSWNTNSTLLLAPEGEFYVAKNVIIGNAQFKFHDGNYLGFSSGYDYNFEWIPSGGDNGSFNGEGKEYDVYLSADKKYTRIVPAGTEVNMMKMYYRADDNDTFGNFYIWGIDDMKGWPGYKKTENVELVGEKFACWAMDIPMTATSFQCKIHKNDWNTGDSQPIGISEADKQEKSIFLRYNTNSVEKYYPFN